MSISLANVSHSIHSIRSPVTEMYGGVRRALRNMVEKTTEGYEVYVEHYEIWSKRVLRGTRRTETYSSSALPSFERTLRGVGLQTVYVILSYMSSSFGIGYVQLRVKRKKFRFPWQMCHIPYILSKCI